MTTMLRHRHHALPLQASAQEAEVGAVGGAGDRADRRGEARDDTGASQRRPQVGDRHREAEAPQGQVRRPPDLSPEEHRRRGDAATELWREVSAARSTTC